MSARDAARELLANVVRGYQQSWGDSWTPEQLVKHFAQSSMGHSGKDRWHWGSGYCYPNWPDTSGVIRVRSNQAIVEAVAGVKCTEIFTLAEIAEYVVGARAAQMELAL